nr:MAG TPA: tail protein [Caudoviricetes sp.]
MSEVMVPVRGGGTSSDDVTASRSNVLLGKTTVTSDSDDEIVEGTMPNCGAKTAELACGESYPIPEGYHDGKGKVTAKSLASQTSANAGVSDILTGKTAYVNGSKVTGTMANQGAKTASLNCGGSYTIPAGYHNGSGKVTANSLASQTSGTAAVGNILKDKTAWVNGNKITGTIASRGAATITPGTANQTIVAGQYLSGAQTIKGDANLKAANIALGTSIFGVAGNARIFKQITGSVISKGTTRQYTDSAGTTRNLYWLQIDNLSITPLVVCAFTGSEAVIGDASAFNVASAAGCGNYYSASAGYNATNYKVTKASIQVPIGTRTDAKSSTVWYRILGY